MLERESSKLHRARVMHLFAGAGGGLLADLLLGHQCICAVENDFYCQQVLAARQKDGVLPWFPIFADVREFDGRPWRGITDVIAGGFPCTDISCAGRGAGITGEKSSLWREMARIIGEVQPRYAFVENSPLLRKRGLAVVLSDLAEMGYDAKWCVLGADDVGAPHIRKRMWVLAYPSSTRRWEDARSAYGDEGTDEGRGAKEANKSNGDGEGSGAGNVANTYGEGSGFGDASRDSGIPESKSEINSKSTAGGGSSGGVAKNWWEVEPPLGRMASGMAFGLEQLKCLGNGQVPLCAAMAWKILSGMVDDK